MNEKQSAYFKSWYASKKADISAQRKKRYAEDPAYRQAVLDRGAQHRAGKKKVIPLDYVSMPDAADALGVSYFVLRFWGTKGYMPEPIKLGNKAYITQHQFQLLIPLRDFLKGRRHFSTEETAQLEALVSLIYSNWV